MALTDGLVAFYKLGDVNDALGTNNLTNNNTVTFVAGKVDNCANFVSSSSQSLTNASVTGFPTGSNAAFSMSAWVKTTATFAGIGGWGTAVASGQRRQMEVRSGTFYFGGYGAAADLDSGLTCNSGNWTHVVITSDGTTKRTYVNNVAGATETPTSLGVTDSSFNIGNNIAVGFMNGQVDAFGVWNRALSVSEVSELYNAGNGVEYPFTPADTGNGTSFFGAGL